MTQKSKKLRSKMLEYGFLTAEGFKTGLHCPGRGCGDNGPINMNDRDKSRSLTGHLKTHNNIVLYLCDLMSKKLCDISSHNVI